MYVLFPPLACPGVSAVVDSGVCCVSTSGCTVVVGSVTKGVYYLYSSEHRSVELLFVFDHLQHVLMGVYFNINRFATN